MAFGLAQVFRTFGKLTFDVRAFGKLTLAGAMGAALSPVMSAHSRRRRAPAAPRRFSAPLKLPTQGPAQPIGFYAKGCMSGAEALPADGPTWQAMRLSRNRRWGNPVMISLLEQFSQRCACRSAGAGHPRRRHCRSRAAGRCSTAMPRTRSGWMPMSGLHRMPVAALELTNSAEDLPFTTMLQKEQVPDRRSEKYGASTQAELLMLAASYPQVERIFVNPAIKKKMCDTWTGDRNQCSARCGPIYGHDLAFPYPHQLPCWSQGAAQKQAAVAAR